MGLRPPHHLYRITGSAESTRLPPKTFKRVYSYLITRHQAAVLGGPKLSSGGRQLDRGIVANAPTRFLDIELCNEKPRGLTIQPWCISGGLSSKGRRENAT